VIDQDPPRFAAEATQRWWRKTAQRNPAGKELLITAETAARNGTDCQLWKVALQDLPFGLMLPEQPNHLPPGARTGNTRGNTGSFSVAVYRS
jgi:hypothetical protein